MNSSLPARLGNGNGNVLHFFRKITRFFFSLSLQNLTRWGGALLELSQFQNFPESKKMTEGTANFLILLKSFLVN